MNMIFFETIKGRIHNPRNTLYFTLCFVHTLKLRQASEVKRYRH